MEKGLRVLALCLTGLTLVLIGVGIIMCMAIYFPNKDMTIVVLSYLGLSFLILKISTYYLFKKEI